ncbi:MAG: 3'-5' exonuclease [Candidatus Coprenecus sp.]
MKDFAAIDFETANEQPSSVCSVGVVIVREGKITDSFYSLIRPEPQYYKWFCQRVHGLGPKDTEKAPVFPHVWKKIGPLIEGLPLVAHNSRFDEGCLKAVFRVYQMDYPEYIFHDTLTASRRHFGRCLPNHQLHTVAAACGYDLVNHHHALADAQACAAIAMKLFQNL